MAVYRAQEYVLSSSLFGDLVGVSGLLICGICGLGVVFLGAMINFILGSVAALMMSKNGAVSTPPKTKSWGKN